MPLLGWKLGYVWPFWPKIRHTKFWTYIFSSLSTTFCQGTEQTLAAQLAAAEANQILDGVGGETPCWFSGVWNDRLLTAFYGWLFHWKLEPFCLWLVGPVPQSMLIASNTETKKAKMEPAAKITIRELVTPYPSQIERRWSILRLFRSLKSLNLNFKWSSFEGHFPDELDWSIPTDSGGGAKTQPTIRDLKFDEIFLGDISICMYNIVTGFQFLILPCRQEFRFLFR